MPEMLHNLSAGCTCPHSRDVGAMRTGGEAPLMGTRCVVVAGRRPPMLLSLKRLLEPEFEVAAMADNVLSLLDAIKEIEPDLLVLDTGSVEFGAVDLARRLRLRHPGLPILLVGDESAPMPEDAPAPRMVYVAKLSADSDLVPAARALLAQSSSPSADVDT